MSLTKKIGRITDRSNGGMYSGEAFDEAVTTSGFDGTFLDLGFRPNMIFIENVSGTADLDVAFKHDIEFEVGVSGVPENLNSRLAPGDARIYRARNHRTVALKSDTPVKYKVEAW